MNPGALPLNMYYAFNYIQLQKPADLPEDDEEFSTIEISRAYIIYTNTHTARNKKKRQFRLYGFPKGAVYYFIQRNSQDTRCVYITSQTYTQ